MTRDARTTMESLERCFSLRIIKSRRPRATSVNVFKNKSKLVEQGLKRGGISADEIVAVTCVVVVVVVVVVVNERSGVCNCSQPRVQK